MFATTGYVSPRLARLYIRSTERRVHGDTTDAELKADLAFAEFVRQAGAAAVLLPGGSIGRIEPGFFRNVVRCVPFQHRFFDVKSGRIGVNVKANLNWLLSAVRYPDFDPRTRIAALTSIAVVMAGYVLSAYLIGSGNPQARTMARAASLLPFAIVGLWYFHLSRWLGHFNGGYLIFSEDQLYKFVERHYGTEVANVPAARVNSSDETTSSEDIRSTCADSIIQEQITLRAKQQRLTKEQARNRFGLALSVREFDRAWADASRECPELRRPGRPKNTDTIKMNPDGL